MPQKVIIFLFTLIMYSLDARVERIEEDKITGGFKDLESEWAKYTASIRTVSGDLKEFGMGHFCGGSIITKKVILSAAHCLAPIKRSNLIQVVVGSIRRLHYGRTTQVIKVFKFIIHPDYDPIVHFNDISIVKLRHNILIDGMHADVIALPNKPPLGGTTCTAAGWGQLYWNGPQPDEIIYINLQILNETECRRRSFIRNENEFCAKDLDDMKKDSCQGDSGGPLFCNDVLVGITSRGPPCGDFDPRGAGIYTTVYDHLDWIMKNGDSNMSTKYLVPCVVYIIINLFTI